MTSPLFMEKVLHYNTDYDMKYSLVKFKKVEIALFVKDLAIFYYFLNVNNFCIILYIDYDMQYSITLKRIEIALFVIYYYF